MQKTKLFSVLFLSVVVAFSMPTYAATPDTAAKSKAPATSAQNLKEMLELDSKEALDAMKAKQAASKPAVLATTAAQNMSPAALKKMKPQEPPVYPDVIMVLAVYGNALSGKQARIDVNGQQSVVAAGDGISGYKVSSIGSGCVVLASNTASKNLTPGRFCFVEPQPQMASSGGQAGRPGERSFAPAQGFPIQTGIPSPSMPQFVR